MNYNIITIILYF